MLLQQKKEKNNNVNTLSQNRQPETDNTNHKKPMTKNKLEIKICLRQLVVGSSGCGKTYLMNHILHQRQKPIFIITKSLNQYLNIKAQTSDKVQPLENYKTALLFLMLCYYQDKKGILIFFYARTTQ